MCVVDYYYCVYVKQGKWAHTDGWPKVTEKARDDTVFQRVTFLQKFKFLQKSTNTAAECNYYYYNNVLLHKGHLFPRTWVMQWRWKRWLHLQRNTHSCSDGCGANEVWSESSISTSITSISFASSRQIEHVSSGLGVQVMSMASGIFSSCTRSSSGIGGKLPRKNDE